jgi:adenylate kinase
LPLITQDKSNPVNQKRSNLTRDFQYWTHISEAVSALDASQGYIIQGFPRNIEQALLMELNNFQYDLVIDLYQPEELILAKAKNRTICMKCDKSYNSEGYMFGGYSLPALEIKNSGICDDCGETLLKRKDDENSNVKRRFFDYLVNMNNLRPYFEKKNKLLIFDLMKGVEDFNRLTNSVDKFFRKDKNNDGAIDLKGN